VRNLFDAINDTGINDSDINDIGIMTTIRTLV